MNDLRKTQVATYLSKSDKRLDEVTAIVYEHVKFDFLRLDRIRTQGDIKALIRDVLTGVVHGQQATKLIEAETLLTQARIIQEAEGDTSKVVTDNFDLPIGANPDLESDIEEAKTNYSRTYCSKHKCEDRDITDMNDSDNDEFFCGDLDCGSRTPDQREGDKKSDKRICQKEKCQSYRPYPGKGHCQVCVNNVLCRNVDDYFRVTS